MTRVQWLRIHRTLGLFIAAFLFVQALTGALLLYRGPAARIIDPAGMTSHGGGPAISTGGIVISANRALPGFHITRLFAPDAAQGTWIAQLSDNEGRLAFASIDPADGAVLRAGNILRFPIEAALQIHYRLAAGTVGEAIVAFNALALLGMTISGLAYWWPRNKPMKALTIRWSMSPRLVLRQVHRTLGVIAAAFLTMIAGTGLLLILPELTDNNRAPPPIIASAPAIDRSMAMARAAFPHSRLRDVRFDADRMIINFDAPEFNSRAVHRVTVSIDSPHILSSLPAERNRALWITILPIHSGTIIAPIGPALLLLVALTLAALALSGPIMWWQASAQRRRAARKVPA